MSDSQARGKALIKINWTLIVVNDQALNAFMYYSLKVKERLDFGMLNLERKGLALAYLFKVAEQKRSAA